MFVYSKSNNSIPMETQTQKLETPLGQSYWGSNGAYQRDYDRLFDKLVPSSGYAPTIHGEMIRCAGRLFYDFCNNGNCNAVDLTMEECHQCGGCGYEEFYDGNEEDGGEEQCRTEDCHWCDGSGQDEGEKFVTEYYQEMLDFLFEFLTDNKCVYSLEQFMLKGAGYSKYKFDEQEMDVYNKVVDAVMYQVLTTNDKQNPYFKQD
jgi:hypothetical protein